MEAWNREELYVEVWQKPLVKVAEKHGVSAVLIGKVCRKLKIPLPGRGYWVKKEFGKQVEHLPLPEAKDLPVVMRFKESPVEGSHIEQPSLPEPEPTDEYYKSIVEMESRAIPFLPYAKKNQLTATTEKILNRGETDNRGILVATRNQPACLDIRVTKDSFDRALTFANAIVVALEMARFPITVQKRKPSTTVLIFGHAVPFSIVEKSKETGRREVKEYGDTRTKIDYKGSGTLEFRAGDYAYGRKLRDGRKGQLESTIAQCIGALMREARDSVHQAERARLREIEWREEQRLRIELSEQIQEEEKRVKELNGLVDCWIRAKQMREFISALEKNSTETEEISQGSPRAKKLTWMKQQADRLDPLTPSPPSILDRKNEIRRW